MKCQVQAALAQLLNPFAYYQPHLAALLQQSQLTATNHVQQPQQPPQIQVQNGIGTPVAAQQQQKLIENLLAEQVIRNPTTHDKIDISQPVVADNRNVGLLTSAESVKEHISRLISENEAILEQNPGLIKRRPYHRQVGSQSSIELETGIRSQSNSPGLRDVRLQFTHGQSFYESHKPLALRVTGGPLTNGHPIVKALDKCTCNYCELKFPNDAALVAHEIRCSKSVLLFIFILHYEFHKYLFIFLYFPFHSNNYTVFLLCQIPIFNDRTDFRTLPIYLAKHSHLPSFYKAFFISSLFLFIGSRIEINLGHILLRMSFNDASSISCF
ncbi:unnamed protein product [Onchocerca flexuosa]|uniref:C2H2-type domain-containing protein n=1 Tax=Onchocerca flexuosa TaxID=387005 RepID=A0A183HLJ0_9BILA|nr:unnamed protein product [Onchocerca flexuosa]